MTEDKLAAILGKQMPDAEKRARADFVVDTSQGFDAARAQVRDILSAVATDAETARGEFVAGRRQQEICAKSSSTPKPPASTRQGHRLVEIGCIELLNRIPTGARFHAYLNPDRDMPAEAFAIHGLSAEFLQGQAALRRRRR